MNRKQQSVPVVIPPALDVEESELAARNEFLAERELMNENEMNEFISDGEENDEIILDETDAAPGGLTEEREAKIARRTKRRKSMIFLLGFGAVFGIFVVFVSWAFGFGFFAAPSRVSVDRNQKTNGVNPQGTTTGDEKLKTALALVADETGGNLNSPVILDSSTNPNAASEEDLKLTADGKTSEQSGNQPSGNMIVLPNENNPVQSNPSQNQIRVVQPSQGTLNSTPNLLTSNVTDANSIIQPRANNNGGGSVSNNSDGGIVGRSIFFGRVVDKNPSPTNGNVSVRDSTSSSESANVPPFGTLLPVRFLGAVYTLRGAGGLVRMELVRSIKKGELSYPAGTVIVGRLRGSETNRAFISAFGAIEPKSGKLVKFEGEVLGIDGASGVKGERKSVKSWGARFLSALREAGGQAINLLAARGGRGGTIVLNGTSGLGGEVSSIVRGDTQGNSFVVVRAGTEAYVLITDLPDEQREGDFNENDRLGDTNRRLPGINLSESEMAEILTSSDANKIRAALLKMSPQFRALAIKAMEEEGK